MAYEDIYNPDTSRYGDASRQTLSQGAFTPLPISPTNAYYGGYMDKGDLQGSTSTLHEVTGTLKNVLGQISGAISTAVSSLRNTATSLLSPTGAAGNTSVSQPIIQPQISPELGRYVGSATFLQSATGALTGGRGSPYLLSGDYQQLMSESFAKRSTLLGGSVASVATEMGAGWLGSKMLGPLISKGMLGTIGGGIAGYMGGGYLASHVMGRVNQGMEFDSLLKDTSSRLGINEGGPLSRGFSPYSRRKIAKDLRDDGSLKKGDYADIMEYGSEYGMFSGVTNSEQFTDTVKSAAKQVKTLMKVLREPDVRDVFKDMATFRQWGVPQGQMVSFAMHADSVGRATGLTAQGMLAHMSVGAQRAQQMGLLGRTGASLTASGRLMGRAMLESGRVSADDMARATGGGGASEYGELLGLELQGQADTTTGKYLLAAMSKKGEKGKYVVDEDVQKRYLSGKISSVEMSRIGGKKMSGDTALAKKVLFDPKRLREEIMPDENEWFATIAKSVDEDVARMMKGNKRLSREQATLWVTDARAGSEDAGERLRNFMDTAPEREEKNRGVKSRDRITAATEAARGKQGLSRIYGNVGKTAHDYTIGWVDKKIDDYIVDPAIGIKDQIVKKATDFGYQKGLGLHISHMPGAVPEGYVSPGKLSTEAAGRVEDVVSQTGDRAAKMKTNEGKASVWADKIKDEIEGFGSTKWSRDWRLGGWDYAGVVESPGEKLKGMGAYEHLGSYMTAQEAVLGGGGKDALKKLSEKYKLNPADMKKAEELYDVLQELLKQNKITIEALVEQNKRVVGLRSGLDKTGAGQSREAHPTQQADYPEDAGGFNPKGVEGNREDRKVFDEWTGEFKTTHVWDGTKGEYTPSREYEEMVRSRKDGLDEAFDPRGPRPRFEYNPDVSKINDSPDLAVEDSRKNQSLFERVKSTYDAARQIKWKPDRIVRDESIPLPDGDPAFEYSPDQEFDFDEKSGDMAFMREEDIPETRETAKAKRPGHGSWIDRSGTRHHGLGERIEESGSGIRHQVLGVGRSKKNSRTKNLRVRAEGAPLGETVSDVEASIEKEGRMAIVEAEMEGFGSVRGDTAPQKGRSSLPAKLASTPDSRSSDSASVPSQDIVAKDPGGGATTGVDAAIMGSGLWKTSSNVDSKESFAEKGMVEVAKGKWVGASMAQHYGNVSEELAPPDGMALVKHLGAQQDGAKPGIAGVGVDAARGASIPGVGGGLPGKQKSPGAELVGMGASKHLGAYVAALSGAKGDEGGDIEKVAEKYKLSPDDKQKAKELYGKIEEFKKQKRITEEAIIEQLATMTKLYTDASKAGSKKEVGSRGAGEQASGEVGGRGRAGIHAGKGGEGSHTVSPLGETVCDVEASIESGTKHQPDKADRHGMKDNDIQEKYRPGPRRGSRPAKKGLRLADREGRMSKTVSPLGEKVSDAEASTPSGGDVSEKPTLSPPDGVALVERTDVQQAAKSGEKPKDATPAGVVEPVRTDVPVDGEDSNARWRAELKKHPMGSPEWQKAADMLNRGKSKLTKEDHSFSHIQKQTVSSKEDFAKKGMVEVAGDKGGKKFVEADMSHHYEQTVPASAARETGALSQFTSFDAWKSRWSGISYSDVNPAVVVGGGKAKTKGGSKLTPDTTGRDLFENAGSEVDSKESFAKKGMVEVGEGRWVSASMAQHYGKASAPASVHSQDIVAKDAGGEGSATTGVDAATKALGTSQGGLANSAEKTAKTLDRVAKSAENFMGKFSNLLLGARNSNNNSNGRCY